MANYHLEGTYISRGNDRSFTKTMNYISGQKLYDCYNEETYYRRRDDVLYCKVILPDKVPCEFSDLQYLCNKVETAAKRYDSRTAREFKASLPNELSLEENVHIVNEFVENNFLCHGLCAVVAIHEGKNEREPSKNNPHAHIIVPTRTVSSKGLNEKTYREFNKSEYMHIWRAQWADVQNQAYERNNLPMRVSHESLEVQGIRDREPANHLSLASWQRERRGEHTPQGDKRRAIDRRNRERTQHILDEHSRDLNIEMER